LKHWATSQKVAGSIPDGFFQISIDLKLSAALWPSTQPLTEMSTRDLPGVKSGRCVGLKTLAFSRADFLEILGYSTSWIPWGLCKPVQC
jgi:hypothetical protein